MILALLTTVILSEFASMVEADVTLTDRLDLSKTVYLADVGRHVVIHDACEHQGRLYLAGGATSPSSLGGMDAVLFIYEDHVLVETVFKGGYQEDHFYGIHCGQTLWVSGYSNSPDFLNDSTVQNFGKAFLLELDPQGQELNRFVSTYGFESHLYAIDATQEMVVAVGQVQRITESDVYVVQYRDGSFHEIIHPLSGYDRLEDVEIGQTIKAVGYSNSAEIGANGIRGILVDINEYSLDVEVYKSSSDSRFSKIQSGLVLGSLNSQGLVYDPLQNQTTTYSSLEEVTSFDAVLVGTSKQQSIMNDTKLPGRLVTQVGNTYVFQEEGVLYKAYLYVPYLLERIGSEITLNKDVLMNETLEVSTTSLTTQLVWKLHHDEFEVITRVVHHPNLAFCNLDDGVYYHPVTLLCNQPVLLDQQPVDPELHLAQPKDYELQLNDRVIRFEIREPVIPVIQRSTETPRLVVKPTTNNWWMIPMSWMGLFLLKKLQE